MRIFLSLLVLFAIEFHLSPRALGQKTDASLNAIKSLGGVVIQEKDGLLIGVDFRKCDDDWVNLLPKLHDIPSLQSVSMTGPLATHARIETLSTLPNLRTLRLDQTSVTDETVATIAKFEKLEDLNLEGCKISDDSLASISQRETLKRLRLGKTTVSDNGLVSLKAMKQLELLDLSDCNQITSDGLANLSGLTKLRNLSIGSPLIADDGLKHLVALTNMVALSLKGCAVTDAKFDALAGMSKLKEFDMFRTRGGDRALGVISNCKEITKLKLRDSAITNKGLIEHITKFENLTSMDLGETQISDEALIAIGKLSKLEDLNLLRTKVTSAGVAELGRLKLKRLNLDDIASIGDSVVQHVAKIPSLEFLHLGKTAITDSGLQGLAPLANLKDLILNDTAITDAAINQLQIKLPKLKIQR